MTFLNNNMADLAARWLQAKEGERDAVALRRQIEDDIKRLHKIDQTKEGVWTFDAEKFQIKVTTRFGKTIDSEKLQSLALDAGLSDHLSTLFRWKPEVNMKAWKATSEDITRILTPAITSKSGRPTFNIKLKETV